MSSASGLDRRHGHSNLELHMATLLSIPTAVTVLAPGSSVLSTIVAAMAPGIWAQLSPGTSPLFSVSVRSTGSMLPYCNAMPWNRVSRTHRDHRAGS